MNATDVTTQTFEDEVLRSAERVIVDFSAAWCAPCRAVERVLDEIAEAHAGDLRIVRVDIDAEWELAARYAVSSIPTLILFDGGQPVARETGARSRSRLETAFGLA